MLFLFWISATITVFLIAAAVIMLWGGEDTVDARLLEVASSATAGLPVTVDAEGQGGLAQVASGVTGFLKPVRGIITGSDDELAYRLTLAGFRKPEHVEIFTAAKMLLPIGLVIAASFVSFINLFTAIVAGLLVGFFVPDMFLSHLISKRQESIRHALPDAIDLLVICMEAGLGIDQAMVRVGDEIKLTSPPLAEEFQIINREQRAGKPRLDAWRSMAARVDLDYVREFITMLVQTERFGTPIANALGQFADTVRLRRTQAAEEIAAKTGVKLLFPLIFCIFPSIFVVALLPAILGISKMLGDLAK
jgi:tight adherence protein C